MSIKDRLIHRARKQVIIGTNKIGMLACCFYMLLKFAYISGEETFRYWDDDLIAVGIILVLLLAWETLMWIFRIDFKLNNKK
jgi:hypothetical protein